jgi:uncharacterized membrane protein (DUF441 family)
MAYPGSVNPKYALNAGIMGTIVGGTAALGLNLHKVQEKKMTMGEALTDSLVKGAGAGVATAAGTAVASAAGGGFLSLALMIATATGVSYALNSIGKSASEKAVSVSQ